MLLSPLQNADVLVSVELPLKPKVGLSGPPAVMSPA
jgi:hypothetical protein